MVSYIDPRVKLFGHLDKLAALKAGQRPAPVNVEIDLTNRCSLGCQWCHFAYTHTRGPWAGRAEKPAGAVSGGDVMEFETAVHILEQLEAAGVRSVTWTGGGEPTLHPRIHDVLTAAAGLGLDQGLYTHGGHLTPFLAMLARKVCTWVYVSLDCTDAESYRREKGVDGFERACAGVRNLVRAGGQATVGVGFLLHAGNWGRADEMLALGRALGADYVQFRPAVAYRQDAPGEIAEDTAWVDDCIDLLYGRQAPDVICDIDRFQMYRDWDGHGYATCWWAGLQTVITPNGKMWRCVNTREHAGALLGDLTRESFADIWQRAGPCPVGPGCRVLCRGHVANVALDEILRADRPHANFI
ncbi:MAG TPA: radical SAM/SPASM domain-containing protein [Streptosporangiaceae bacterium]